MTCPSCGDGTQTRVLEGPNGEWEMWHCPACGCYPMSPVPENPTRIYTKTYFESGERPLAPQHAGYVSYDGHREAAIKDFSELFKPWINQGMRVLDIGCATGIALEALHRFGIPEGRLAGIDVSPYAIEETRRRLPRVHLRQEDVTKVFLEDSVDCILLLDVLEHVANPAQLMEKALHVLPPGGRIVVTTPDPESMIRHLAGSRWSEFHPGEHLCFVSLPWFSRFARSHGLQILSWSYPGKRVTLEHALLRLRSYLPFIPKTTSQRVFRFNMFDRLCVVLEKR